MIMLNTTEISPVQFLENTVKQAIKAKATDIHLKHSIEHTTVYYRIEGQLFQVDTIPSPYAKNVLNRIKYLARLKTYIRREPQDGEIKGTEFGFKGHIRVSVYPIVDGEKIALRIFNQEQQKFLLDELHFPQDYLDVLKRELLQPEGLLLFTGPSGSGKTSTIYSSIIYICEQKQTNIITIEDPVEYHIPGITQTQVDLTVRLDFPQALRSLLRQDPEVIVIGEIRDQITAEIALKASLTGHLVISTIHAGSVVGTLNRLLEMNLEPFLLASSIRLITAQRLVRLICQFCQGVGCDKCMHSGYKDMEPLVEYVFNDDDLARNIREPETRSNISQIISDKEGFFSLSDRGKHLVENGKTYESEITRVLGGKYG